MRVLAAAKDESTNERNGAVLAVATDEQDGGTKIEAPDRPRLRGWSHVVAAVAAIAIAPVLIAFASPGAGRVVAAIYGCGVIGVFLVSGIYHRLAWTTRFQGLFRRLDHSMIFVFIAATYTPFAAFALDGAASTFLLWFVWVGALIGISIRLFWLSAPRWVTIAPYLVVGWCALLVVDDIWRGVGQTGFLLVVIGGALYTLGALVYAGRRPNPVPEWFGYHEVFHALVVGAVAVHYVAVAFFALPLASA